MLKCAAGTGAIGEGGINGRDEGPLLWRNAGHVAEENEAVAHGERHRGVAEIELVLAVGASS